MCHSPEIGHAEMNVLVLQYVPTLPHNMPVASPVKIHLYPRRSQIQHLLFGAAGPPDHKLPHHLLDPLKTAPGFLSAMDRFTLVPSVLEIVRATVTLPRLPRAVLCNDMRLLYDHEMRYLDNAERQRGWAEIIPLRNACKFLSWTSLCWVSEAIPGVRLCILGK